MLLRLVLSLSILLFLGSAALSNERHACPILYHDGLQQLVVNIRKVDDVQVVDRTPIFDNVPFLSLKKGDRFVRAKMWSENGKGVKPGFSDQYFYFVHAGDQYFLV